MQSGRVWDYGQGKADKEDADEEEGLFGSGSSWYGPGRRGWTWRGEKGRAFLGEGIAGTQRCGGRMSCPVRELFKLALCVYSWTEVPLGWCPPSQPSLDSKLNRREKDSPFVLPWCPELHTQVGSLNLLLGTEGQMFLALWCK